MPDSHVTGESRGERPPERPDSFAGDFSRTLIVGVIYGLVAWFHVILCPAYVLAGLVPAHQLRPYGLSATAWAVFYLVTGGVMFAVAVGMLWERRGAWRIAPWAVLPNLACHLVLISVLPVWGLVAIASDLLAIRLVVDERRRQRARRVAQVRPPARPPRPAPPVVRRRASARRAPLALARNRRAT